MSRAACQKEIIDNGVILESYHRCAEIALAINDYGNYSDTTGLIDSIGKFSDSLSDVLSSIGYKPDSELAIPELEGDLRKYMPHIGRFLTRASVTVANKHLDHSSLDESHGHYNKACEELAEHFRVMALEAWGIS